MWSPDVQSLRAQVDMAGDTMVACSMASTGEALTFGGSGGYVHLWALSHQPRINSYSEVCDRSCTAMVLHMLAYHGTAVCVYIEGTIRRRHACWCLLQPLEVPPATPQPAVRLTERDSFGLAESHYPEEVWPP
jgi:hypothetical protein